MKSPSSSSATRTSSSGDASRSTELRLGKDRQPEPAGLGDRECPAAPVSVLDVRVESKACLLRALGELVDVLRRAEVDPHAHTLLAVTSFLPVILIQADKGVASAHHHAEQRAAVLPSLLDSKAQCLEEGDALLKVVDRQARRELLHLQRRLGCCRHVPASRE